MVVTEEVARHLAAAAATVRYDSPDRATIVAEWSAPGVAPFPGGGEIELSPEHGSGLRGLADRVDALGGDLTVASAPGKGTTVSARLPMTTPRL
jgi:signal transduction histidine kinase